METRQCLDACLDDDGGDDGRALAGELHAHDGVRFDIDAVIVGLHRHSAAPAALDRAIFDRRVFAAAGRAARAVGINGGRQTKRLRNPNGGLVPKPAR